MYKSVIHPEAKQDIKDAAKWYNKQKSGLGKRFTKEVRETVHFIKQNPKAVAIRYKGIRTATLNVFPYMIHYSLDDKNQSVVILAVLSMHRNPEIWNNS